MKNTNPHLTPLFGASPSPLRSRAWAFLPSAAAILTLLLSTASSSFAGSATWKASPATGDWNTATNWTPQTVPNGPSDVATFATSNQIDVSISADTQVNDIVFNAGASAFTVRILPEGIGGSIGNILGLSGGIINNAGLTQNFVMKGSRSSGDPQIEFLGSATAGSATAFTLTNGTIIFLDTSTADDGNFFVNPGGFIEFVDGSNAGNATFVLNGSVNSKSSGQVTFSSTPSAGPIASAGNANFTLNAAGGSGGRGGQVGFLRRATADNATFVANGSTTSNTGPSEIAFFSHTTAGNAMLTAKGGTNGGVGGVIQFLQGSHGGTARVAVFGNGNLDVTRVTDQNPDATITIGSLEGSGKVFLGATTLGIGRNDLSTTFSGVIADCPASNPTCGSFGSLSKIGKSTLTLSHNSGSTYTGGTIINKGTLIATNNTGSATGSGAVQVNSGTLSGTGKINGGVTVGNGTTVGAILQPGVDTKAGTLTINNTVSFNPTSAFKCYVNRSTTPVAGKLSALGVTIGTNVSFTLVETGTTTLTPGTVFTVINNTSANPISGTFSNLPDGGTITSGNGTVYKANYEGGTGNDLILTVQ